MLELVFQQILTKTCNNEYSSIGQTTISDNAMLWCEFVNENQTCNIVWSEKEDLIRNITENCIIITKESASYNEEILFHQNIIKISKGGTYSFYIYNCTPEINEENINSMVKIQFLNQWGYLPPRIFPIMVYSWIESFYFIGLLIAGVINKCHHPLIVVSLHNLVLLTVTSNFVSSFVIALTLTISNSYFSTATLPIVYTFRAIKLMLICILCISIAIGISIVVEDLPKKEVSIAVLVSFLFGTAQFFTMLSITGSNNNILIILSGISYILFYCIYCATFSNYVSKTLKILNENMVQISDQGIDPFTTPTYRKIEMINGLRKTAVAILMIDVLTGLMLSFFTSSLYILYILGSIIEAGFLTYITWEARIRKKMAATYMDNEDAYIISEKEGEKTEWEFGVPLPKLPTESHNLKKIYGTDPLDE